MILLITAIVVGALIYVFIAATMVKVFEKALEHYCKQCQKAKTDQYERCYTEHELLAEFMGAIWLPVFVLAGPAFIVANIIKHGNKFGDSITERK